MGIIMKYLFTATFLLLSLISTTVTAYPVCTESQLKQCKDGGSCQCLKSGSGICLTTGIGDASCSCHFANGQQYTANQNDPCGS